MNDTSNNDVPREPVFPVMALEEFAASKPWRGTQEERIAKFEALHAGILEAYEVPADMLVLSFDLEDEQREAEASSGASYCTPRTDGSAQIVLVGKLSVVTYLTLLATVLNPMDAARDQRARAAHDWALATFGRFFPRSARRLTIDSDGLARSTPRRREQ